MNPFQNNNNLQFTENIQSDIDIWVETNGRKKNTYVSGWSLSDDKLKEHLSIIKKKNGCNGTIKFIETIDNTTPIKVLHLQGNHTEYLIKYLIDIGCNKELIHVRG
jgi:translation initiation factor 1 (eIF-1/SUI1)